MKIVAPVVHVDAVSASIRDENDSKIPLTGRLYSEKLSHSLFYITELQSLSTTHRFVHFLIHVLSKTNPKVVTSPQILPLKIIHSCSPYTRIALIPANHQASMPYTQPFTIKPCQTNTGFNNKCSPCSTCDRFLNCRFVL